jgi:hypothetical protein
MAWLKYMKFRNFPTVNIYLFMLLTFSESNASVKYF